MFSINNSVQSERGGWMSLEGYCNSHDKGEHLMWAVVTMDEELLCLELGGRVVNEMITDWPDIMNHIYEAQMKRELDEGKTTERCNW